ncbi:MAG: hypothetical protein E6Q96_00670 [Cyclobacteriaceae bacterium]|nr:MAG: hypothetical protein E6Q96_00670 [Cyclobacteriaceae bacterium]
MRFIIIILFIQFISSGYAQAGVQGHSTDKKAAYQAVHRDADICLDVLFSENSEENKETNHRAVLAHELIDFSFLTTVLTQQPASGYRDISNLRLSQQPLFKLNCIYLI